MPFEHIQINGKLSQREMQQAGALINQGRSMPVQGSGNQIVGGPGGSALIQDAPDYFVGKITAIVNGASILDPKQYAFKEQWQNWQTGDWEDSTSYRAADGTNNWAVAPKGESYSVDDLVVMRRHRTNPNLFEILFKLSAGWYWYRITGRAATTPPTYSWERVRLVADAGSGIPGWVATDPAVTGSSNAYRAPTTTADPPPIPTGQVVLGRPSPTYPDKHELTAWGGQFETTKERVEDVVCDNGQIVILYRNEIWSARELCVRPAPG